MAFQNFSWVIPGKLAGCDLPGAGGIDSTALAEDIKYLADEGIRMLVSLERPAGPMGKLCRAAGITWRDFPVMDFGVPENSASFRELVNECIRSFDSGRPVCVHCRAGIGRTGMLLACIMGVYFGLGASRAVAAVKEVRPAVETDAQRMFITSFLEQYES
jgi:atypical dual specificity phosphatase